MIIKYLTFQSKSKKASSVPGGPQSNGQFDPGGPRTPSQRKKGDSSEDPSVAAWYQYGGKV